MADNCWYMLLPVVVIGLVWFQERTLAMAKSSVATKRVPHVLDILNEIGQEYTKARLKFPKMNSGHEGYAVILEELEELWLEIKQNDGYGPHARKEAIQVAAMALAYVLEVCV